MTRIATYSNHCPDNKIMILYVVARIPDKKLVEYGYSDFGMKLRLKNSWIERLNIKRHIKKFMDAIVINYGGKRRMYQIQWWKTSDPVSREILTKGGTLNMNWICSEFLVTKGVPCSDQPLNEYLDGETHKSHQRRVLWVDPRKAKPK